MGGQVSIRPLESRSAGNHNLRVANDASRSRVVIMVLRHALAIIQGTWGNFRLGRGAAPPARRVERTLVCVLLGLELLRPLAERGQMIAPCEVPLCHLRIWEVGVPARFGIFRANFADPRGGELALSSEERVRIFPGEAEKNEVIVRIVAG